VLDATRLDHSLADRLRGQRHRRPSERNFALAAELRGSRIELRDLNVYELDPDEVGAFDLVVMAMCCRCCATRCAAWRRCGVSAAAG
jgi:hypothetical protein